MAGNAFRKVVSGERRRGFPAETFNTIIDVAQHFKAQQQNILGEIVRGCVAPQVTPAVQPHARREAAIQLGLFDISRSGRPARNPARERFVADVLDRSAISNAARSVR